MSVITDIAIDADEFVLGRVLADTTTCIELTQFVSIDGQLAPYFWKAHDGDRETFEQSVRDHPAVAELSNLDDRVNSHLYSINRTDEVDGFLDARREQDIFVEEACTTGGEAWLFHLRAIDQEELSAFQSACPENEIPLDLRRVIHNPDIPEQTRSLVGATPRQQETLTLAIERGYFHVPRDVSGDELGEELGIAAKPSPVGFNRANRASSRTC